ncbi:MAG TPA: uracil-DNA glycosylase, partial [Pseudorhizobium sp.]|nr:uracil-DNA glycosylase [Pseudorhizobium sp.]
MVEGVKLEESWKQALAPEFSNPYMSELRRFLLTEKEAGKRIFPKGAEYFRALDLTPLDQVKVVILGQDPYHGHGQAHGLCFSVQPGVRIPPSLVNIYKELHSDLGVPPAGHGFLEHWARQGVLLLNSVLTVEEARAASHQGKGWERFTDAVIRVV